MCDYLKLFALGVLNTLEYHEAGYVEDDSIVMSLYKFDEYLKRFQTCNENYLYMKLDLKILNFQVIKML